MGHHVTILTVLAPSDYHLFGQMKGGLRGKHHASNKEVKTTLINQKTIKRISRGRNTCSYLKVEHCYGYKGLIFWKVIHREPSSFWRMINVFVLVIIPVLKKKALLFDSPSYYYNSSYLVIEGFVDKKFAWVISILK